MGYYTTVYGEIAIDPPLSWAEVKDSPFLDQERRKDVHFRIAVETVDTDEGTLERRQAVAIEPYSDDSFKAYSIEEHLGELLALHGEGHTFTGWLEGEGEEAGDLWRLGVKDGRPHMVRAQIVWPE